jgi:hypothetical protein
MRGQTLDWRRFGNVQVASNQTLQMMRLNFQALQWGGVSCATESDRIMRFFVKLGNRRGWFFIKKSY